MLRGKRNGVGYRHAGKSTGALATGRAAIAVLMRLPALPVRTCIRAVFHVNWNGQAMIALLAIGLRDTDPIGLSTAGGMTRHAHCHRTGPPSSGTAVEAERQDQQATEHERKSGHGLAADSELSIPPDTTHKNTMSITAAG